MPLNETNGQYSASSNRLALAHEISEAHFSDVFIAIRSASKNPTLEKLVRTYKEKAARGEDTTFFDAVHDTPLSESDLEVAGTGLSCIIFALIISGLVTNTQAQPRGPIGTNGPS